MIFDKYERGRHRVYIGMAPGVGKTYRMLQEAQELREEGIDVVIGCLETHGREETAQQAEGLEQVPPQEIVHRGKSFLELDTEGILARQPYIVLIDELAHTNIPGSLRNKRYQDVEVILNAGIHVFSTVNIQHLESLNDLVAKLTGVIVRESIPDRILAEAYEVVVVDVTPETLQERLLEGKIYAPAKIEDSLHNFFQRQNLIALRELALREVANNIEETADVSKNCSVYEKVLVCLSTYPNSIKLLRRGSRLANQMKASLYAVFVDHPDLFLTRSESLHVEMCQRFCQESGGEFLRVTSANIPKAIAQVAKEYSITQIVLGQTRKSRWELFLRGSVVQHLMQYLKDVDLHVIMTDNSE